MEKEKVYHVNEIFYSLQGEGRWAGRAAIFVRFSGCNLKCPFCDTDSASYEKMTMKDILRELMEYSECSFVVLTGGEPTLQVTKEFVEVLHKNGYYVAMETNGTRAVPDNVDWVTVSPKVAYVDNGQLSMMVCDEVKVVYDGEHTPDTFGITAKNYYVQPCDVGSATRNAEIIAACVRWVKQHPMWRLSLQQQKILRVR